MTHRVSSSSPHQLVDGDRQGAHALAGGVKDRVGDGRGGAHDADLADALDAERIDQRVLLLDEDHVDVVNIRIHRHMIFGETVIHDAAELVVDQRLLMQRHADAAVPDAADLAARPAATALTPRVTRITPSSSSILTSAKTAECVNFACLPSSSGSVVGCCSMRSTPPARMASVSETARAGSSLPPRFPSSTAT